MLLNVIVRLVLNFIRRIERILIKVLIIIMRLLKRLLILIKIIMDYIKPYINHRTFKSGYRKYVIDTRYQNDYIGPQPIELNLKFSAAVADVICQA